MNKILRVFLNVNLNNGHKGLSEIAKKYHLKTESIEPGSYMIFVNSARDKIKIYASNEVIAYYRAKGRIDLRVIAKIPQVFNGRTMNFDKALELMINERLKAKTKEEMMLTV